MKKTLLAGVAVLLREQGRHTLTTHIIMWTITRYNFLKNGHILIVQLSLGTK
jgi:hypothetical protein